MQKTIRIWRGLSSALLVVLPCGCLVSPLLPTQNVHSIKADQREQMMLKSKVGTTPLKAGFDDRAQEIENSLGIR